MWLPVQEHKYAGVKKKNLLEIAQIFALKILNDVTHLALPETYYSTLI